MEANVVHCRLAEGARKAVQGWGLELLCKDPRWRSDALTVIETPKVCTPPLQWCPFTLALRMPQPMAALAICSLR